MPPPPSASSPSPLPTSPAGSTPSAASSLPPPPGPKLKAEYPKKVAAYDRGELKNGGADGDEFDKSKYEVNDEEAEDLDDDSTGLKKPAARLVGTSTKRSRAAEVHNLSERGLGKTLQTISLLGYLHEFRGITGPHLVVAPKYTLGNWMNEIQHFCPVLHAVKFLGNPHERKDIRENLLVARKFNVCVTSFEMVIKEKTVLRRFSWCYVIIDEAHQIKNENSLLSKTMRLYSTTYHLLIIGTPLQKQLQKLS